MLVVLVAGGPLLTVLGRGAGVHRQAELYLNIVAFGLPAQLLALAGEGCLRGMGDLRTPLRILVIANAANVVLELVLVYGAHLGLAGSAIGTLIAQLGMGLAFAWRMWAVPADSRAPSAASDQAAAAHGLAHHRAHGGPARRLHAVLGAGGAHGAGLARGPPDRVRAVPVPGTGPRRDRDSGTDPARAPAGSRPRGRGLAGGAADARLVGGRRARIRRGPVRMQRVRPAHLHERCQGDRAQPRRVEAAGAAAAGGAEQCSPWTGS